MILFTLQNDAAGSTAGKDCAGVAAGGAGPGAVAATGAPVLAGSRTGVNSKKASV